MYPTVNFECNGDGILACSKMTELAHSLSRQNRLFVAAVVVVVMGGRVVYYDSVLIFMANYLTCRDVSSWGRPQCSESICEIWNVKYESDC